MKTGQVWILNLHLVRRIFQEIVKDGDWKSLSSSVIGHRKFGTDCVFNQPICSVIANIIVGTNEPDFEAFQFFRDFFQDGSILGPNSGSWIDKVHSQVPTEALKKLFQEVKQGV